MKKVVFLGIFLIILLSPFVYGADDAIKVGNTYYAGDITLTERTIRGLTNADTIEFLIGEAGYALDIDRNSITPTSIRFKQEETDEIFTVNINEEYILSLSDGSKVYINYLEYERLNSKLSLRAEAGSGVVNNPEDSGDESTTEESSNAEVCPSVCVEMWEYNSENKSCGLNECGSGCGPDGINAFETEENCIERGEGFSLGNKKLLIYAVGAVVVLIIIIILLIVFKRKGPDKFKKKDEITENRDDDSNAAGDSFFDPIGPEK